MLRLWRWTFARLYVRNDRKWGRAAGSAWTASCAVTGVIASNVLAAAAAVAAMMDTARNFGEYKAHAVALGFAVLYLVHHNYVIKGSAAELIKRFKRQSREETRREERRMWLYTVVSLAMPGLVALVGRWFRGD